MSNESVESRRDFARRVGRVDIEENWDSLKNRVKKMLRKAEGEGNGIKEKRLVRRKMCEEKEGGKKKIKRVEEEGRRRARVQEGKTGI